MQSDELKRRISAGRGDALADLVLKNVRIVNVFTDEIDTADIAISGNSIVGVGTYHGRKEVDLYGKNLTFKTGGVDGCDCEETLRLIAEGKIDTEPLITHTYPLRRIAEGYELFEKKRDGVIKVAVEC